MFSGLNTTSCRLRRTHYYNSRGIPRLIYELLSSTLRREDRRVSSLRRILFRELIITLVFIAVAAPIGQPAALGQAPAATNHPSFEILRHRMDVDVDGAPTAYGPKGKPTLDYLINAHLQGRPNAPIVGYLLGDDNPRKPVLQGPRDPAPGYYISQTAYTDKSRPNARDVLRYVDATRINYVVLGHQAKKRGVKLGDFVAVYSQRTHKSVFAIVADDGNPSGDEGSLHLLQDLGYPFHDGKNDAVEESEIIVRFYPGSNPGELFFRTQAALNEAAAKIGLSRDFPGITASKH